VIGQKTHSFVRAQYELPGYGFLFSQSHRCISPCSSNQGISPDDSVNYSGWPLPHVTIVRPPSSTWRAAPWQTVHRTEFKTPPAQRYCANQNPILLHAFTVPQAVWATLPLSFALLLVEL